MRVFHKITHKQILIGILFLAIFTRFFRLGAPNDYVFDEVYHAFTAQEMVKRNNAAWEWWNSPPESFAYEWTHPPMAKLIMGVGIKAFSWLPTTLERIPNPDGGEPLRFNEGVYPDPDVHRGKGDNPFGWRFPVAVFSVGIVFLMYQLGKELFSQRVGLIAAFLATFDGLFFVMGRIGMNDTFFLFFQLGAFLFFIRGIRVIRDFRVWDRKRDIYFVLTGIFLGLALASKWTAVYGIFFLGVVYCMSYLVFCIKNKKYKIQSILYFFLQGTVVFFSFPILVYLASYIPFFNGHSWEKFLELQQQMWWYHMGLSATHGYQSNALSWPFMIRSVWCFVKYGKDSVSHIYALGNPVIWWSGIAAIIAATVISCRLSVVSFLKRKKHRLPITDYRLLMLLAAYFAFFIPWVFSPRIMFLYHYYPSLSFLILILAYFLDKIGNLGKQGKVVVGSYLVLVVVIFIYFYPILAAVFIPTWWENQYFWLPSWK